MNNRYDIAIIGSGPAGLQAALSGISRNKKVVVFGTEELSNKVVKAEKINNYLGVPFTNGKDMKKIFQEQVEKAEIEILYKRITAVYAMGDFFALMVNEEQYEATSVVLATGVEYTKPIKGEVEYLGRGVGYCATCDAPLYRGKKVAIIGYNRESIHDAEFLSEMVEKLYFIPMMKEEVELSDKIEVIRKKPVEIIGESRAEGIQFKESKLEVDGIFVMKDSIMADQLVPGLEIEDGHIKVDRNMQTNLAGCYAAGDCIGKPYQYIKAAGEGCVAALSAVNYIDIEMKK